MTLFCLAEHENPGQVHDKSDHKSDKAGDHHYALIHGGVAGNFKYTAQKTADRDRS